MGDGALASLMLDEPCARNYVLRVVWTCEGEASYGLTLSAGGSEGG